MNCSSCGVDIPAAWKNVFAKNECPNCSGKVMNDALQELIKDLGEELQKLPVGDAMGLAGWLVSNYSMKKIGSCEPVNVFYGGQKQLGGGASPENLKIAPNPADEFLKRKAGNSGFNSVQETSAKLQAMAAKNDKMAALAAAVRQAQGNDVYGTEAAPEPEEMDGEVMQEDMVEYQNLVRSGINPFKGSMAAAAAAGGLIDPRVKPLTPDELAAAYNIAGGSAVDPDEIALSSSDEGRKELMKRRLQKLKKHLMEGGSIGKISRSSG